MRDGHDDAFGELYRRHIDVARAAARSLLSWGPEAEDVVSEAFTRVLSILQRGGGPEEAFRPYLLTCVRHACYDRSQGIARSLPVDPGDIPDLAHSRQRGELDLQDTSSNSDLLARAFASLPERWQLVLWSTEVDGRRPAELAKELGLAPGAVASLAYRAREGLTEAFLSAHLQRPAAPACAALRPRLAAFVRDNVSAREEASIQSHLDQCSECQDLVGELRELNRPLRGLLVPAVVGVSASAYLAEAATGGGGLIPRFLQFLQTKPVFGGAAAASVAVLTGATFTGIVPLKPAEAPTTPTAVTAMAVANGSASASLGDPGRSSSDPTGALPGPGGPLDPGSVGGSGPAGRPVAALPAVPGAEPTATVPTVSGPGVSLPATDLAQVSLPPVSLPAVSVPAVSVPPVSLPPVSLPPVSLPAVSVPPVAIPGLPTIALPAVTVPVITVPVVTVPVVTVPVVTVPVVTVPVVTVPVVTVPPITLPPTTVPPTTGAVITLPPLTTPTLP